MNHVMTRVARQALLYALTGRQAIRGQFVRLLGTSNDFAGPLIGSRCFISALISDAASV